MIAWLDARDPAATAVPDGLQRFVGRTPSGLDVVGDRTAGRYVFAWRSDTAAAVSLDLDELIRAVRAAGHQIELDPFGVSMMLHNSFVPLPHTVYRGIAQLSMGDSLELRAVEGRLREDFGFDYPWIESRSRGDSIPDEDRLLAVLTAATERQLAEVGGQGFLMLSSGVDSPAIALALSRLGRTDIECVTYRYGPDDPESPVAAGFARRLGLRHSVVDIPDDPDRIRSILLGFFERSPLPGVDQSQIPYLAAIDAVEDPHGAVFEGGGNDSFMSHFPSSGSRRKQRFRLRPRALRRSLAAVIPMDSPLNYMTRSRAEATFPGRTPRQRHLERLYGAATDVDGWWEETDEEYAGISLDDLYDVFLRRHIHAAQVLLKHELAAKSRGLEARLPWCDEEVADYYFHLPQDARFDRESGTQKVLLKRMLAKHLDYDAAAIGKHYFIFDGAGFLRRHEEFVRAEVEASPLWEPEGKEMVLGWLDALERRPMLWHAVLEVFMISGWSNHYPAAVAATAD